MDFSDVFNFFCNRTWNYCGLELHSEKKKEKMIDLNFISKVALEYSKAREKNKSVEKGSTLNLLKHCAMEVIEATDAYTILCKSAIDDEFKQQKDFSSELADVIMCILIIAAQENIDVEEALKDCLEKNRKRAEI